MGRKRSKPTGDERFARAMTSSTARWPAAVITIGLVLGAAIVFAAHAIDLRERAAIEAVLQQRQESLARGERASFLRSADADPVWRRFQEIVWTRRFERPGPITVRGFERFGMLRRVRAAVDGQERVFLLRRSASRWVTTEPSDIELGSWRWRQAGPFHIHYHARWDDPQVIDQLMQSAVELLIGVSLNVTVRPERIDIFLHHRAADREALGWEVITERGASRRREVHLWSPNSYGWGPRADDQTFFHDLRAALARELLFILPGF